MLMTHHVSLSCSELAESESEHLINPQGKVVKTGMIQVRHGHTTSAF